MNNQQSAKWFVLCTVAGMLLAFLPSAVNAHCDTMNGPVVTAAKKALETGDVNLVLIWVQTQDEPEIRAAFAKTLHVRRLGQDAKELADRSFFETLVRIHRAREGVPFTGLKPATSEVEPGIAAADKALDMGSSEELVSQLNEAIRDRIREQLTQTLAKKAYTPDNVVQGRQYVKAYVEFIHYVERLYQTASQPAEGHFHEGEQVDVHRNGH